VRQGVQPRLCVINLLGVKPRSVENHQMPRPLLNRQ
jgi:hypothetical protein